MTDAWNVYSPPVAASETPTINELSYRSDNQSGLNFGLQPSTNDTVEIGSKTRIGNGLFTAALFQTDTDNEIVVDASSGRPYQLQNAGKPVVRDGAGAGSAVWRELAFESGLDWLDATYRTNVCDDASCNGNRIPGIARNMGYASFGYQPSKRLVRRKRYSLRHERHHGE